MFYIFHITYSSYRRRQHSDERTWEDCLWAEAQSKPIESVLQMPGPIVRSCEQIDLAWTEVVECQCQRTDGEATLTKHSIKRMFTEHREAAIKIATHRIALGRLAMTAIRPDHTHSEVTGSTIACPQFAACFRCERMRVRPKPVYIRFRFSRCNPAHRDRRRLVHGICSVEAMCQSCYRPAPIATDVGECRRGQHLEVTDGRDTEAFERCECFDADAWKKTNRERCKESRLSIRKDDRDHMSETCRNLSDDCCACKPNLGLDTGCRGDGCLQVFGKCWRSTIGLAERDRAGCPATAPQPAHVLHLLGQDSRDRVGCFGDGSAIGKSDLQVAALASCSLHRHANLDASGSRLSVAVDDRCAIVVSNGNSKRPYRGSVSACDVDHQVWCIDACGQPCGHRYAAFRML